MLKKKQINFSAAQKKRLANCFFYFKTLISTFPFKQVIVLECLNENILSTLGVGLLEQWTRGQKVARSVRFSRKSALEQKTRSSSSRWIRYFLEFTKNYEKRKILHLYFKRKLIFFSISFVLQMLCASWAWTVQRFDVRSIWNILNLWALNSKPCACLIDLEQIKWTGVLFFQDDAFQLSFVREELPFFFLCESALLLC